MGMLEDPFGPLAADTLAGDPLASDVQADAFALLQDREVRAQHSAPLLLAPVLATLHGFDLLDQPQLTGLPGSPGQVIAARSAVALRRAMVGSEVLVVFIDGDLRQPVITGVLLTPAVTVAAQAPGVAVQVDGERHVISAEREIVLRCGDASITLTRAGKVIIKGNYILSRSTGYNKIKGAAIDIN